MTIELSLCMPELSFATWFTIVVVAWYVFAAFLTRTCIPKGEIEHCDRFWLWACSPVFYPFCLIALILFLIVSFIGYLLEPSE